MKLRSEWNQIWSCSWALAEKDLFGNDDKVRLCTGLPSYAALMRELEVVPH